MWKFLGFEVFVSYQQFSYALFSYLSLCIQESKPVALLRAKYLIYILNPSTQIVPDIYLHNLISMRTQALNLCVNSP